MLPYTWKEILKVKPSKHRLNKHIDLEWGWGDAMEIDRGFVLFFFYLGGPSSPEWFLRWEPAGEVLRQAHSAAEDA